MSKEIFKQRSTLTDNEICDLVAKVKSLSEKYPEKERLKITLTFEQILLNYQLSFGKDKEVTCTWKKDFFRGQRLIISSEGKEYNPLIMPDEKDREVVEFIIRMLNKLGLGPYYQYLPNGGGNVTTIKIPSIKRKFTLLHQLWIATVMAVLTLLVLQFLPEETATIFTDDFVTRIFRKMVGILATIATPMIFFALLTGIVNIGNVTTLGNMGKTVCSRLSKPYLVAAVVSPIACVMAYPLSAEAESGESVFGSIFQLILDILPDDLITPLQINNDLQVIVIAIFLGIVILMLKDEVSHLYAIIEEAAAVSNKMMSLVCKFLPLLIYFGIISVSSKINSEILFDLYKFALSMLSMQVIVTGFVIWRTYRLVGKPLKEIIKPTIPALLINLATSSQMAAYPASEKCCKEDYGVDPKLFDFAFPMGVVLYMPNGAVMLSVTTWAMLYISGVPADLSMLIKVSILGVIIAIAAPPIPGSGLVVLPILMAGVGVPLEFMPLGALFVTVMCHPMPAMNGFCLQLEMLALGKKLDMLKKKE